MGALHYLAEHGLTARQLSGDSLEVFPSGALSADIRAWIRKHKPEILEELRVTRRRWYRVTTGTGSCKMICPHPMTRDEALRAARRRWDEAEIDTSLDNQEQP